MAQRYLILDYETRSACDLKVKGAIEYADHPSTEILCLAWRLGTIEELKKELKDKTPARAWSPFVASSYGQLIGALCDPTVIIVAHNALFEQAVTRYTLSRIIHREELKSIPPERWICTAALAAALALPRNLEGACLALGLNVQKDMEGRRLILKYCKPRNNTKHNHSIWHRDLNDLKRLIQYCRTDVDAETELFLRARPLIPSERALWILDQKINQRGFAIDRPLVKTTLDLIDQETQILTREMIELTDGQIRTANQRDKILKYIRAQGAILPDLKSKTVSDVLKLKQVHGKVARLLEIRQSLGKTSTAKYHAFNERVGADSRVRDNLIFHAASTGRWSGAGVQPQNFPRGSIKNKNSGGESAAFDMQLAVDTIKSADLEWVKFLYKNPMNMFASCLRGVIIPSPEKNLFCADYAAVEARMLFWFANHEAGMQAFREGRDLYREMASSIYGIPIELILKDSIERFVGKGVILGCGYQMGGEKFQASCLLAGVEISDEAAELAVKRYREKHAPVTTLWYNMERAAIAAVRKPGTAFTINHTKWFVQGDFLWCELPSGRRLAYYKPVIKVKKTKWGQEKAMLHHWGIDQYTRKWVLGSTYGGKLTENVVQAASRDLMAAAMIRVENAGYEVILSVHDELLAEREKGKGSAKHFSDLMAELPPWAKGAPIAVSGWMGDRYRK